MDLVQTATNAAVVAAVGIILGFMVHGIRGDFQQLRGEFQQLRGDFNELRTEVRADIGEVRREMGDLRREIGEVRSDLTQVALAVGARPRAERNR